jgi:beta-ribofuranosylaminobenzene 5'-phosphate synthase
MGPRDSSDEWLASWFGGDPLAHTTGSWIRVKAPSRLHFGLLVLPAGSQPVAWPDLAGQERIPARHFGGVGLMVQAPGVQIAAQASDKWLVVGPPQAQRVRSVAENLVSCFSSPTSSRPLGPCNLVIEGSAPEHCGLGTGTQISLAVAKAVLAAYQYRLGSVLPPQLATLFGRGHRSSVGIHGFGAGGLIVDGGRGQLDQPCLPVCRLPFPESWKILLVVPRNQQGMHGLQEQAAFSNLPLSSDLRQSDAMCRLIVLGMLPAVLERDLSAFGEALYDFNRRAGEMFRSVQGGVYSHARTAAIVDWLRNRDIRGVGQSSWGPTVFAIVEEDQLEWLKRALRERFGLGDEEVIGTEADNRGASVVCD